MEANKELRSNLKAYSYLNQMIIDGNGDPINLALKAELDYLHGRNEELRAQIIQYKADLNKSQTSLTKAQDEVHNLIVSIKFILKNLKL